MTTPMIGIWEHRPATMVSVDIFGVPSSPDNLWTILDLFGAQQVLYIILKILFVSYKFQCVFS